LAALGIVTNFMNILVFTVAEAICSDQIPGAHTKNLFARTSDIFLDHRSGEARVKYCRP
jgi:hypothetical protein